MRIGFYPREGRCRVPGMAMALIWMFSIVRDKSDELFRDDRLVGAAGTAVGSQGGMLLIDFGDGERRGCRGTGLLSATVTPPCNKASDWGNENCSGTDAPWAQELRAPEAADPTGTLPGPVPLRDPFVPR